MKKILAVYLALIICNNAFGITVIKAGEKKQNPKKQVLKAAAGLAGAFTLCYLSYKTATNPMARKTFDKVDAVHKWFMENTMYRMFGNELKVPYDTRLEGYISNHLIPILLAIGSFESAKYSIRILTPLLAEKLPQWQESIYTSFAKL